ncbi:hypothetical protein ACFSQ3_13080 [Sphingobacterium corticis]|uniref:Uncharacterized protein n=1 Tax=Sphingobacterium corticis TaxID=1812823 RepID=A0ABW5NLZ7_9SPHI
MDNTLENKAKFFAQYWDQTVLMNIGHPFKGDNKPDNWYKKFEHDYLLLKPLSAISDEDAMIVAKLIGEARGSWSKDYEDTIIRNVKSYLSNRMMPCVTIKNSSEVIDYLRSKGYLLPFNGVSREEILNRGWAVLESEVSHA